MVVARGRGRATRLILVKTAVVLADLLDHLLEAHVLKGIMLFLEHIFLKLDRPSCDGRCSWSRRHF